MSATISQTLKASILFCLLISFDVSNQTLADVVFSENWLDDNVGSAPNATPDVGDSVRYYAGDMTVFDVGGGEKSMLVTATEGSALQYVPLSSFNPTDIAAEYVFNIETGASLAGLNALVHSFTFDNFINLQLYWGNDMKLRVYDSDGSLISDSFNYELGRDLSVDFFADLNNDTFSLFVAGATVVQDASIGADVSEAPIFGYSTNFATVVTTELQHFTMHAAAVPEPGAAGLLGGCLIAFAAQRRKRNSARN